mmetsp:Transcript_6706/g.11206  ORF Transcript_6706/g.11206 Transcript_6706/m.11206 type:complete len:203 (-) Transcript_6706:1306-1914(-)
MLFDGRPPSVSYMRSVSTTPPSSTEPLPIAFPELANTSLHHSGSVSMKRTWNNVNFKPVALGIQLRFSLSIMISLECAGVLLVVLVFARSGYSKVIHKAFRVSSSSTMAIPAPPPPPPVEALPVPSRLLPARVESPATPIAPVPAPTAPYHPTSLTKRRGRKAPRSRTTALVRLDGSLMNRVTSSVAHALSSGFSVTHASIK